MEPIQIDDEELLKRIKDRVLFINAISGQTRTPYDLVFSAVDKYLTKRDYYSKFQIWKKAHAHNLWLAQNGRCYYCKTWIAFDQSTFDHKHPFTRGGKLLDRDNIVVACQPCNGDKGILTAEEYEYKQLLNAASKVSRPESVRM